MIIKQVIIENIKSIEKLSLTLDKGITLINGENDIGKTTIFLAIQTALSGKMKKHLIRYGCRQGSIYVEFIDDAKYEIKRTFYDNKSASAEILVNGKPVSVSTESINDFCKTKFKFFNELGFLYYSKIGKILMEHSIKKDNFLIEFFELSEIMTFIKDTQLAVKSIKAVIPDWFYTYDCKQSEARIQELQDRQAKLTAKLEAVSKIMQRLTAERSKASMVEGKQLLTKAEHTELSQKLRRVTARLGELVPQLDQKKDVFDVNQNHVTDVQCPFCESQLTPEYIEGIRGKMQKDIAAAEKEIKQLRQKKQDCQGQLEDVYILQEGQTKDSLQKLDMTENRTKFDEMWAKRNQIQAKLSDVAGEIGIRNQELKEYRRVQKEVKDKNVDALNQSVDQMIQIVGSISNKLRTNLLQKINELMFVVYKGKFSIDIQDGQLYLLHRDEQILLDELSSSGSALEIITFIFTVALSIISGSQTLLIDELFNTCSLSKIGRINTLLEYISQKYIEQILMISHRHDFKANTVINLEERLNQADNGNTKE
jgi:DNA repair exonuclease SbcCD ATPase subunit